jgi:hypothetical protein
MSIMPVQPFFILFFVIYSAGLSAQSFSGVWHGKIATAQDQTVSMPATITFRLSGSQLTGNMILQNDGVSEHYTLAGTVQGKQAVGSVTYPTDGSVFQFEGLLQNNQFVMAIGLLGVPVLAGTFARPINSPNQPIKQGPATTTPRPNAPPTSVSADGLPRNQRLAGAWGYTRRYSSGDFYGSTRTVLIFFPDGRMGNGGSSGNASLPNSSVSSTADGIEVWQGVRWYTKGEQIWLRYAGKGSAADQLYSEFAMTMNGQTMMLYRNGGKQLYERVR